METVNKIIAPLRSPIEAARSGSLRRRRLLRSALGLLVLALCVPLHPASAQEDAVLDDPVNGESFIEHARRMAGAYELRLVADNREIPTSMRAEPVLRWTNPLGGRQVHGEVFLWTAQGRPAAVLSLYEWTGRDRRVHETHEFCSLAETELAAVHPDGRAWSPTEPGVAWKPIAGADSPLSAPRLRLRQMRELAERFVADKTTREGVQRSLRLLPQPVYRNEGGSDDFLDGALFAFVEATDPEAFLMIEARPSGSGHEWQYAFARMTNMRLRGFHSDALVWEAPELPWRDVLNREDKAYTAFKGR